MHPSGGFNSAAEVSRLRSPEQLRTIADCHGLALVDHFLKNLER
jgi:hypothetical protein